MVLLHRDIKPTTILLIFLLANSLSLTLQTVSDSLTYNLEAVIDCE